MFESNSIYASYMLTEDGEAFTDLEVSDLVVYSYTTTVVFYSQSRAKLFAVQILGTGCGLLTSF